MTKIIFTFISGFIALTCLSQNNRLGKNFEALNDIFGTRSFVENKGQFDKRLKTAEKILYALDNGSEKIYFTPSGLIYELKEHKHLDKEELEEMESENRPQNKQSETYFVKMNWINTNFNKTEVIASGQQKYYITYGTSELNSNTFKKITYKNVYEDIDIEYTIPETKAYGIKYNVIIHPGGDPKQIKILYSGDIKKIKAQKSGEVIINTLINEPIIVHQPYAYTYGQQEVTTSFKLSGDTIGFALKNGYDKNKTLIIDPWVTSLTNLVINNAAYDVDYDFSGNTYIYGGEYQYKVAKYDSNGSLLWTFSGSIFSVAWLTWSSEPNDYAGNFCVDKYTGKIFIGQGVNVTGSQIVRLNSAGNYDNFISAATPNYQEVWDMSINCYTGYVFTLGGGHNSNLSAAIISNLNMNLTFATFQPSNLDPRQDIASHCIDDNGNVFVIYSTNSNLVLNNKICRVNSTFNGNIWTQPTTFSVMVEAGNKLTYGGSGANNSNGLNCLAVNSSYLYYYDGYNLAAYSLATGTLIMNVTLAGGSVNEKSGIAVDDCNNLYLGGIGQVLVYKFTGSSFNALTSIAVGGTLTNTYVYDIKLNKSSKTLYVCGSGFAGNYSAINSATCMATSQACVNSYPVNYVLCSGGTVTLTPSNYLNLSYPTYSILPGPVSNSNGTFIVSPNSTTTYTTFVSGTYTNNVIVTLTSLSTVSVISSPVSVLSPSFQIITCTNTAIPIVTSQITPTVNVQHLWVAPQGGMFYDQNYVSSYFLGAPGIYTHCAINDVNGCASCQTFTVSSGAGFPTFNVQSPQNFTLGCESKSLATMNIINGQTSPPGGAILYSFLSPGFTATPVFSGLSNTTTSAPGSWTLIVKDSVGLCESKIQISVLQNTFSPLLDTLIVPRNILDCGHPIVTLDAWSNNPNTSYNWSFPGTPGNTWGNTLTVNANTSGFTSTLVANFTLTVTDNNNSCVTKTIVPILQNLFPPHAAFSLSTPALTCLTKSITLTNLSATGIPSSSGFPNSYGVIASIWLGPSPQENADSVSTYIGYVPGTYTLIARDLANGCTSSTTRVIADGAIYPVINSPTPPNPFVLPCGSSSVTIAPNLNPNQSFVYLWTSPSNTIATGPPNELNLLTSGIGTYTIKVTDTSNGCTSDGTVQVVSDTLKAAFEANPEAGYAELQVVFTNNSSSHSGTQNIITTWSFGNGSSLTTSLTSTSPIVTYSQPGNYSVTIFVIKGTCLDTKTMNISVDIPSSLEIPNIFTPNNDGVNDLFFLETRGLEKIDVTIYDRWGAKVYELVTGKGNIFWDGKNQHGKELADGVYFYVLNAKGMDGKNFVRKGNITLVR
jgi:gliding motility-associated-like protein